MMSTSDCIESNIAGIPCLIRVISCNVVAPHKGSKYSCDSDSDYYGYADIEFSVLDRKGYKTLWLEKKMTSKDKERIENEILCN